MINGETPIIVRPLATNNRIIEPKKLPGKNEPLPPKRLVPPRTANAIVRVNSGKNSADLLVNHRYPFEGFEMGAGLALANRASKMVFYP